MSVPQTTAMIDRMVDRIDEMYWTGQTSPEAVRRLISEFPDAALPLGAARTVLLRFRDTGSSFSSCCTPRRY
jgi:hypothetical protein